MPLTNVLFKSRDSPPYVLPNKNTDFIIVMDENGVNAKTQRGH